MQYIVLANVRPVPRLHSQHPCHCFSDHHGDGVYVIDHTGIPVPSINMHLNNLLTACVNRSASVIRKFKLDHQRDFNVYIKLNVRLTGTNENYLCSSNKSCFHFEKIIFHCRSFVWWSYVNDNRVGEAMVEMIYIRINLLELRRRSD